MKSLLCILLLVFAGSVATADEPALPRPMNGLEDSGLFKLLVRDSEVGSIEFALKADGSYSRTFTLAMAGQKATFRLQAACDAAGLWRSMRIEAPTGTVEVERHGDRAEFRVKEQAYSVRLPGGHIPYDNYGPALEAMLLRAYDMEKGGKQTFSRFIVPQVAMDTDITFARRETRRIAGRDQTFKVFDQTFVSMPLQIWAFEDDRIALIRIPAQYAAFVRQGYEELLAAGAEDPLLSKPRFEVSRQALMVPMRDGVGLATDLYLPETGGTRVPAILIRTPYKKEMSELEGHFYARRGYAVAIQDCRGRFGSQGVWEPFFHESQDGYDAVEWLAAQPWASGKVGMIGGSYVGWVQLWAAVARPPHLTTIVPNVAPPDPFLNIPYEYGSFFILGAIWWADILESNATGDISGRAMARINGKKYEKILRSLPVVGLDQKILGKKNPYWRAWIQHNTNDGWWARANFREKLKDLDLPVFLQSGWYDGDGIGTKLNYLELRKSRNPNIKMVVGPWGHADQASARLGDTEFGPQALLDLKTLYLRWFDYWLKGIDNRITQEPLVKLFVMGSNRWIEGPVYPLPQTVFTRFYLSSQGGANTSRGNGRLAREHPAGPDHDRYTYDPGDPTPHPEYYFKSEDEERRNRGQALDPVEEKKRVQAFHEAVTASRPDILVYQSDPLDEPLTVCGPVQAVLYAASSAPDTDWHVSFMDVDEKGAIFPLTRGVIRARFRESLSEPKRLEKGRVYEYAIDLWHTGFTFAKGHRLRIEVASALFPMFSRNLNTGGHNEMEKKHRAAEQRIFHSAQYPSHVLLPVIPEERQ